MRNERWQKERRASPGFAGPSGHPIRTASHLKHIIDQDKWQYLSMAWIMYLVSLDLSEDRAEVAVGEFHGADAHRRHVSPAIVGVRRTDSWPTDGRRRRTRGRDSRGSPVSDWSHTVGR